MHVAFAHHEPVSTNHARWVAMVRTLAAVASADGVERVTWFTPEQPRRVHAYADQHLGLKLPEKLHFHRLPHVRRLAGLTLNAVFFRACRRALNRSSADVLWLRSDKLAAHVAGRTHMPMVYEAHLVGPLWAQDKQSSSKRVARLERIERRLYAGADGVAAITRGLLEEVLVRYQFKGPSAVVPSGVDLEAFPPVWQGGDSQTVAYVGTLKFWKGLDTLLEALRLAPTLRLLLIGGGSTDEQERLEQRMHELEISDRVELAGRMPQTDIPGRVAHAACAVHPLPPGHSISARFTSPLKIVEYLAMGLPVVAADVPSVRELLKDGKTARLYPAGDAEALARILTKLCTDPKASGELSIAGKQSAKEFSYTNRAARLVNLFQQAGDNPTPHRPSQTTQ
jgi:glycosyltransferase involved in cell wall biosynthesis